MTQADRERFDAIINEALAEYVLRLQLEALGPASSRAAASQQQLTELMGFFGRLSSMASRPIAGDFTVIGRPFMGTHTLGDWQSDNAVDFGIPIGTPILAVTDGTISRVSGNWMGGESRFDGIGVTLDGGPTFQGVQQYWYGHLSSITVSEGQRVAKGDVIGYSGAGNGVPHLHLGQRFGDPTHDFGV